jgi:hypothetical protein
LHFSSNKVKGNIVAPPPVHTPPPTACSFVLPTVWQFPAPVSPAAAARGSATFGASTGARIAPLSAHNDDDNTDAACGSEDESGGEGGAKRKSQSPGPGAYNVRRFAEYPPPSLSSAEENAAALVAGAVLLTEVHTVVRGETSQ